MDSMHDWETIDESEGEYRLEVCIYCGAERATNFTTNKQEITLDGRVIDYDCPEAPLDVDEEPDAYEPSMAEMYPLELDDGTEIDPNDPFEF